MGLQISKAKLASFAGGLCGLMVGIWLIAGGVQAASVSSTRDYNSNAVINGGCLSISECQQKSSQSGTMTIYNYFGISSRAVDQMSTNAVVGLVYSNGTVKVNGKTVATGAMTAGRQNMAGSQAVTRNGTTFFVRPPSVSFVSSPLSAFVVMRDNQFAFAILNSCGNPVMATPVVPPVTKKTPPKVVVTTTKKVTPPPVQTQTQTQTVVVNQPAPQVAAAQTTAPAKIPNTGPGAVIGLGGLATVFGTVAHTVYQRRRL
jgi:hypothetical protein